jgi:peptidyl-prolyl cis-trans isomerase SurA
MRFLKYILTPALLACCLGSSFAVGTLPSPQATPLQPLNRIVARVNADIITQNQFDTAYLFASKQQEAAEAQGMPAIPTKKLKKRVLEHLIAQKIQLQMAKLQQISTSDKRLDATINSIAKEHKISTDQLYQEVEKTGLTKAAYRKQIRDQLTMMSLQRAVVANKATITAAEIKAYQAAHTANVYQVGDILIPLGDAASKHELEKASNQAETIKKALNRSKNFQKTADKYAPENNTLLTWRPLTALPDVFADTIQATQVHHAAGPVRAPNGLHVLYLLGKKKNTHANSTKQIQMILYQQKSEKIISPWLKNLRKTSDIQIMGNL